MEKSVIWSMNAAKFPAKKYGMPFAAKWFSAMGDSYFKTNSVFTESTRFFCTTESVFSLSRLSFFSKLTQMIALQNWLNSFNRNDFLYRTD